MSGAAARLISVTGEPTDQFSGHEGATGAGCVSNDWPILPLSELLDFQNGVNADKAAYGGGMPFANVLEVITHTHLVQSAIPGRIKLSATQQSNYLVQMGDVLFNRTSETQNEIGLASVYIGSEPIVFGGFVIRGRPKPKDLDTKYFAWALRAPEVRSQIIARGQGAIRSNIGQADLRTVLVRLPPLQEQQAIAEVLSDADALIASLKNLIAKKRAIKQGAMQELVTGNRRLPGFGKKWVEVALGELLTFKNGLNKGKEFFGYGTPIINYMDVFRNPTLTSRVVRGRVSLTPTELHNFEVRRGDVLFTRTSETQDEIGLASVVLNCAANTTFSGFLLRGRPTTDRLQSSFAAYWLRSSVVRAQIVSKASYTTRALTNGRILSAVQANLPEKDEQIAIATTLENMDAELAALEAKLTKARQVKQGMMQELLTGRIRLV